MRGTASSRQMCSEWYMRVKGQQMKTLSVTGIQTGMLMGSWGRAGRVHATLRGGHLQEGVGPGGRDMSQGGFLAWSVCLKEGVFVYTVCVVKD